MTLISQLPILEENQQTSLQQQIINYFLQTSQLTLQVLLYCSTNFHILL